MTETPSPRERRSVIPSLCWFTLLSLAAVVVWGPWDEREFDVLLPLVFGVTFGSVAVAGLRLVTGPSALCLSVLIPATLVAAATVVATQRDVTGGVRFVALLVLAQFFLSAILGAILRTHWGWRFVRPGELGADSQCTAPQFSLRTLLFGSIFLMAIASVIAAPHVYHRPGCRGGGPEDFLPLFAFFTAQACFVMTAADSTRVVGVRMFLWPCITFLALWYMNPQAHPVKDGLLLLVSSAWFAQGLYMSLLAWVGYRLVRVASPPSASAITGDHATDSMDNPRQE